MIIGLFFVQYNIIDTNPKPSIAPNLDEKHSDFCSAVLYGEFSAKCRPLWLVCSEAHN